MRPRRRRLRSSINGAAGWRTAWATPRHGWPITRSEFRASSLLGGRIRLDGELDLEDSAEFLAELDARRDELWRQDQAADERDPVRTRTYAERNAAALVEMARRSSAAGDSDAEADD